MAVDYSSHPTELVNAGVSESRIQRVPFRLYR